MIVTTLYATCACADQSVEPSGVLQQLSVEFRDTVQIHSNKNNTIDFCPDNTCETFEARSTVPVSTVADFAYLYLYFFSDYSVLSEWRKRPESLAITKKILESGSYKVCVSDQDIGRARCVLRHLSHDNKIHVFFVRFDEGVRSRRQKNIQEIIDNRK